MRAAIKIELAKPDPRFEMLHEFRISAKTSTVLSRGSARKN
jgi:hypothetical protein